MPQHYETIAQFTRGGFDIIVDKTWEDISPRDQFEMDDVAEIERKIDDGTYDWFMLRVRVMLDGHEFGSDYLGGCLYEYAETVMTDGVAEQCVLTALAEARTELARMKEMLNAFAFE
jgi:hypothetical protein